MTNADQHEPSERAIYLMVYGMVVAICLTGGMILGIFLGLTMKGR